MFLYFLNSGSFLSCSEDIPSHLPRLNSLRRGSVSILSGFGREELTISAVCTALLRGLDIILFIPQFLRNSAVSLDCSFPLLLRGRSVLPSARRMAFHSVCPCLIRYTRFLSMVF